MLSIQNFILDLSNPIRQSCLKGLDSEPVRTYWHGSLYLTSDLVRAFAITPISRLAADPNLCTYTAGRFQETTRGRILRRHRQRILALRQISRQKPVSYTHLTLPTNKKLRPAVALPSFKPVFLSSVSRIYMIFDFSPRISTAVWAIASRNALSCVKET